jgi:hypothetical protein
MKFIRELGRDTRRSRDSVPDIAPDNGQETSAQEFPLPVKKGGREGLAKGGGSHNIRDILVL